MFNVFLSFLFKALQKFVECADKYPESVKYDIVEKYVLTSEECAEIFKLFEDTKRKPAEVHKSRP